MEDESLAGLEEAIREQQENVEKIGYIAKKADTINQLVGNVQEKQGGRMEYHNDHGFVVELWVKKV